jgi:DNA-binding CsgD family transcriptional regulator
MIEGSLDQGRDEHPDPVLLVGDAGMGKSALLDAVARRARRHGVRVVRAAAPQGADATSFGLIEDIARGLADVVAVLPAGDTAVLRTPGGSRTESPGPVAAALLHVLAEASHHQPLLVLLDDLHWADSGSLAALCLAVGRLQIEPVTVIAAARPRPPLDPRLQAWTQVEVGPLDVQPAVEVLRTRLPDGLALEPAQARRVVAALGGCPLAIVECPRLLTAEQLTGTAPLPDLIHLDDHLLAAWGGAWAALPAPTRMALLALCVTEATGGLVGRVLCDRGVSPDNLDPARCDRLVVTRSTPDGVDVALAHPLIRDAILAAAGPAAVRAMHRSAADAATALGLAPSVAIAHLEASAIPGDTEVAAELVARAERALADDLAESAVRALTAAATLTQSDPERSRLAARAARTVLSRTLGMTDPLRILALIDPRVLSDDERIWVEFLRVERLGDVSTAGHLAAMSALADRAGESGSPVIPWLLISAIDAAWRIQDRGSMLALAESLRSWAERIGPGAPVMVPGWACRAMHALSLFHAGEVARAHAELTATRAEAQHWRPHPDRTVEQLMAALVVEGAMGEPDPWVDARLERLSDQWLGDPGETLAAVRQVQAERSRRRGELGVARAQVDEALSMWRASRSRQGLVVALATATLISATLGARDALAGESAELRGLARRNGDRQVVTLADRADGLLALGEGRLDDALLHLEPLAADLLLGNGPWDAVPMGRADLVEALVRSGEPDRAAAVGRDLIRTLHPSPDAYAVAVVARTRGLIARDDAARGQLEAAGTWFRRARDPFEEARTQLLLGEHLRRARRAQDARRVLRAAAAAFERMGADPWTARALAELRATGAVAPEPPAGSLSILTPQERRVAAAVATGASNRQVAAELFLSHRTVAYHLASVYRKLGVSNRTALVARLAQERGAPDSVQAGPGKVLTMDSAARLR